MSRRRLGPSFWERIQRNPRNDLGWRLEGIKSVALNQLPGLVLKSAEAMVALQREGPFGAVIASGEKIAQRAGCSESTFWDVCRPVLEGLGFMITVERGGGRMPGGNGHANVYMAPDAGQEPAEPKPAAPYRLQLNDQGRGTWKPLSALLGAPPGRDIVRQLPGQPAAPT